MSGRNSSPHDTYVSDRCVMGDHLDSQMTPSPLPGPVRVLARVVARAANERGAGGGGGGGAGPPPPLPFESGTPAPVLWFPQKMC